MEAPAIAEDPYFPIYISSDEDDGISFIGPSYNPEAIQIQEAILLSIDSSRAPSAIASSSSPSGPSSAGTSGESAHESPPDRKGKRKLSSEDDPSDSRKRRKRNRFKCTICMEKVQVSEQFLVSHCAHAFCKSCVGRYVAAKVSENVELIGCPDPECAEGFVEIGPCRDIIPQELFDRWSVALCELALGNQKYYCPFKDCSALLIKDNDGTVKIRETECPHCHRLFCARCRVPWHDGIKCKELRKLGDDEKGEVDLMFKKLADKKKWQRCPSCKVYVSRIAGCLLMKCRCKQYFCYHCAAPMKKDLHYCRNCKR
ncbi:E3 ubiquitin-protein ligase RNF144A isoform X2 [Brachypodium distachyon]|uniref:E3 ubiquitin-protein ligase RNF144A isoform X2 n=1 Tax=Brachypodium distachyon TaxID=15368 RepID=UPI000234F5E7|nr:E3 ubiquitin-protein ligase RNF144A isoform X2 [Brachypodium distachyon]|eukprot:XP_003578130.1 E3 ubiquitin-protein ligase RNF144A isoform X2 [Brachypodium distachyon]